MENSYFPESRLADGSVPVKPADLFCLINADVTGHWLQPNMQFCVHSGSLEEKPVAQMDPGTSHVAASPSLPFSPSSAP